MFSLSVLSLSIKAVFVKVAIPLLDVRFYFICMYKQTQTSGTKWAAQFHFDILGPVEPRTLGCGLISPGPDKREEWWHRKGNKRRKAPSRFNIWQCQHRKQITQWGNWDKESRKTTASVVTHTQLPLFYLHTTCLLTVTKMSLIKSPVQFLKEFPFIQHECSLPTTG